MADVHNTYLSKNKLTMNNLWTDAELKHAILAYFEMLKHEKNGTPYVKADMNRKLQKKIPKRKSGSIEYRWQNISAVLLENKKKFVDGYKPAGNVGSSVKERIWKIIKDLKLIE